MDGIIKRAPKDITKAPLQTLIDTSTDKMLSSPSLLRRANVSNLTATAHAYASVHNIKDIEETLSEQKLLIKETKSSLTSTWKQHETELKNLESALSILNEYIDKSGTESMQSHIQEETREDDKTPSKDQDTQSKKDQSL